MTISKGKPWERPADPNVMPTPSASDADAASKAWQAAGAVKTVLKLAPGDLLTTLGYDSSPEPPAGQLFSMDLGLVSIDGGTQQPFVSHFVARKRLWAGTFLVAMNAAWLGDLYLGPRAHPNDGLLDITIGSLNWQQRLLARNRARLGTHLPHPKLTTKRVSGFEIELDEATPLYLDGQPIGTGTHIMLSLAPDAFEVVT